MKLNKFLVAVSISIAILAGLWQVAVVVVPPLFASLTLTGVGVAGFLGWATFYAAGGKVDGLVKGTAANFTGVFWGAVIAFIWGLFSFNVIGAFIAVAIGAGMMCFQAHVKLLSFIPGAFIGCSTFFALGAGINAATLVPTLVGLFAGLVLGFVSEKFAGFLNSKLTAAK